MGPAFPAQPGSPLRLVTLDACRLVIGRYPAFRYDARGGGGPGVLEGRTGGEDQAVRFSPSQLRIPPLDRRSARLLGLPLPPGLAVAIQPELLVGTADPAAGSLRLRFQARFQLSIGQHCLAPPLWIDTELTTGSVQGRRHQARGMELGTAGPGVMVGVALVEPCGAAWLDRFLGLPDEALAVLRFRLEES